MILPEKTERLSIYTGESDRHKGRPLHDHILTEARKAGLAGGTVIRGISGFGANSRLHTANILRLSEDLPILTQIIDVAEKIDAFVPILDELIEEGLVVREDVRAIVYRHNTKP